MGNSVHTRTKDQKVRNLDLDLTAGRCRMEEEDILHSIRPASSHGQFPVGAEQVRSEPVADTMDTLPLYD